jgi:hypothetical protein
MLTGDIDLTSQPALLRLNLLRKRTGRPMTAEGLERVLRRYPGVAYVGPRRPPRRHRPVPRRRLAVSTILAPRDGGSVHSRGREFGYRCTRALPDHVGEENRDGGRTKGRRALVLRARAHRWTWGAWRNHRLLPPFAGEHARQLLR